jgi:Raf kinase inhibitor-like YbhB/YbcL family protein
MQLMSSMFQNDENIPSQYAFCVPDTQHHAIFGPNKNPPLKWRNLPEGTKSLVLICHDPDVPTVPDDVNKGGRTVPSDLPRTDFFHWVLVDLAPEPSFVAEGEFSDGVTAGGKAGPDAPRGTRQGINNYREWFSSDEDMAGNYYGYDGPCPPWNDAIVHHYVFTLYALDIDRCPVEDAFTAPDVLKAIEGHVLAMADITGTYSLNPTVFSP